MSGSWFTILAGLILLPAAQLFSQTASLDTVHRTQGPPLSGRVVQADGEQVVVDVVVMSGQPPARSAIPRSSIERIEFGDRAQIEAFARTATRANLQDAIRLWQERQSLLNLPESPAGSLGLTLGNLLLETGTETARREALGLFERIESGDWNSERKIRAKQGRLKTLVAMGRGEEAIAEAQSLAESTEDPAILIEAKLVLADAAYASLAQLLKENPRWEEDLRVRPERHRLYHEALDLYLYPFLFHGAETGPAARGIRGAIAVFELVGEPESGRELARDLVVLYPDAPEKAEAEAFLKKLPPVENEPNESHEST